MTENGCVPGEDSRLAEAGAPYFACDPDEPHWRSHAERIPRAIHRKHDPQAERWLADLLDRFRLAFVALHERLDSGGGATVTDHEMRRMAELQYRMGPHLDLRGNPLDAALNHTLRRIGLPPAFGQVDRQV